MPAKGEKLTEEHKRKMQEGRRKWLESQEHQEEKAEIKASQEEERALNEQHEQDKARAQAEAAERAKEARRAMVEGDIPESPDPPTHRPTYEPTKEGSNQGVSEWGPYDKYEIVSTPYGQFAVEPGYVMFFESYEFFDDREKRMRTSHRPVYVWAREGKDKGKTRDELVRGYKPGSRRPPKITVPTS